MLDVTATAIESLETVLPAHIWANVTSSVAITSTQDAFSDGLRAYMTPIGTADAQASSLRATVVKGPRLLSAVVPAGLAPADYTIVIVNQDKTVHIFPAASQTALTVTPVDVPAITSVAPIAVSSGQLLTIEG